MAQKDGKDTHSVVRPRTAVLTRGFDPKLSVGSARPAVFRSSTYVFSTPEAAERAFDVATGRAQPVAGEDVELIYSRISHPNAQILEEQIVPLEQGAASALAFNSGMAAIMTAFMTFLRPGDSIVYTIPLYGGTDHLIQEFLSSLGVTGVGIPAGHGTELDEAIRAAESLGVVFIETPANPTMIRSTAVNATVAIRVMLWFRATVGADGNTVRLGQALTVITAWRVIPLASATWIVSVPGIEAM